VGAQYKARDAENDAAMSAQVFVNLLLRLHDYYLNTAAFIYLEKTMREA
jgi:hypothetical protein